MPLLFGALPAAADHGQLLVVRQPDRQTGLSSRTARRAAAGRQGPDGRPLEETGRTKTEPTARGRFRPLDSRSMGPDVSHRRWQDEKYDWRDIRAARTRRISASPRTSLSGSCSRCGSGKRQELSRGRRRRCPTIGSARRTGRHLPVLPADLRQASVHASATGDDQAPDRHSRSASGWPVGIRSEGDLMAVVKVTIPNGRRSTR